MTTRPDRRTAPATSTDPRTAEGPTSTGADRGRGRVRVALALGAGGLAVLAVAQVLLVAPRVERELADRTGQALRAAGFAGLDVDVDGRDVTLRGRVADPPAAARAEQVAQAVDGVRRADGTMLAVATVPSGAVATPTPPELPEAPSKPTTTLVAVVAGGRVYVGGALPDAATVKRLSGLLVPAFGKGKVQVRAAASAGSPVDGLEAFAEVVTTLGDSAVASVTLERGRIDLAGTVASDEVRSRALAQAESAVADAADVVDGLTTGGRTSTEQASAQLEALPDVPFAGLSTRPGPIARSLLGAVAFVLADQPDVRVLLVGHSARTGKTAADNARALARARAARKYLIGLDVPADRIEIDSAGSREPAVAGRSARAKTVNHRLEVHAAP